MADDPLLVREAVEAALEKLEDASLEGKVIKEPGAWAFKVGRHEALRLVKKKKVAHLGGLDPTVSGLQDAAGPPLPSVTELRQMLRKKGERLTDRQRQAVRAVLRHGSCKAASRALAKDPSGFRRLFERALARLRS